MHGVLVVVVAFLAGAIPFSNLAARRTAGVDLREVGTGTVSGTSLFRVAGFVPLAVAGVCDVAKGSVGPLLAGSDRPGLAALAGGAAVAGHNWSPFLRGAGGRGISPAMGAFLVVAWPGTVLLAAGMVLGKAAGHTALGAFVAEVALLPVLAVTHGRDGALAALAVAVPMLTKRVVGNAPPAGDRGRTYLRRLLFDRDDLPSR
ncbi:MAG: glycerol-3-phosphate acyltransferase [Acidimicrobiia bacterium]|nr:glycerol-3-phosphate acyltransferase [Acidimicrobiia bacterium]